MVDSADALVWDGIEGPLVGVLRVSECCRFLGGKHHLLLFGKPRNKTEKRLSLCNLDQLLLSILRLIRVRMWIFKQTIEFRDYSIHIALNVMLHEHECASSLYENKTTEAIHLFY